MAEQPQQPQLTLEELQHLAWWHLPQDWPDGWRAYQLAIFVLRRFLGQEWIDRTFAEIAGNVCGFLNPDKFDFESDALAIHRHRVIDLAEDVFNLQCVEGFCSPLGQLRTGSVETAVAEFEVAGMLKKLAVEFRFVAPTGRRGEDYDLEIIFSDGRVAVADTKCKLEGTPFGEATVSNTLSKTPSQFPPDKPSIVFLKVPQTWLSKELGVTEIQESLRKAAYRFLGATTRVVSVKYFFRDLIFTSHGLVYSSVRYREFTSIRSPHVGTGNWDLFRPATDECFEMIQAGHAKVGAHPGQWVFFYDICDETSFKNICPAVIVRTFSLE